jgi:hypothetical protein
MLSRRWRRPSRAACAWCTTHANTRVDGGGSGAPIHRDGTKHQETMGAWATGVDENSHGKPAADGSSTAACHGIHRYLIPGERRLAGCGERRRESGRARRHLHTRVRLCTNMNRHLHGRASVDINTGLRGMVAIGPSCAPVRSTDLCEADGDDTRTHDLSSAKALRVV